MANTAKSKKAKGTRLEKYIALKITEVLGVTATNMPKSGAIDGFKSDIFVDLPISIEAKNQETWSIPKWWKQCTHDAEINKGMPILIVSRNHLKEPLAIIKFDDLLVLLKYATQNGWLV